MATAVVGPSPFTNDMQSLRAWQAENRKRRKVYYDRSTGLAINSGYMKQPKRYATKQVVASNGSVMTTPDVIDWDDWLDIFTAQNPELSETYLQDKRFSRCQNMADLADYAFNKTTSPYYTVKCVEGSHIRQLDYHPHFQVLKAYFEKNGNVCCYFFVPRNVFATLEALAESPATRIGAGGVPRHLVGIYFWDLIRVRGTITGNRYRCIYVEGGSGYTKAARATFTEMEEATRRDVSKKRKLANDLIKEGQKEAAAALLEEAAETEARSKSKTPSEEGEAMRTVSSRLTPDEAARRDAFRWEFSEDPDHPLKALLERPGIGEHGNEVLLALMRAMRGKAANMKSEADRNEYMSLGRKKEGDASDFDGVIRQEEFLVKKKLWPPFG